MTTSTNAITIPVRTNYTFDGYYSGSGGTGTQYITSSGYATSEGLTAAKGYTNNQTWYAKWTASAVGIHSITTMQEMTSTICSESTTPTKDATTLDWDGSHNGDTSYVPRTKLKDTRDNNYYLVSKLADGNCWMSQSLALDLTKDVSIIASTTDGGTTTVTPSNTTQTSTGTSWSTSLYTWYSYHPQSSEAYYKAGTTKYSSPTGSGDEYLWEKAGNYYNWYAATAGTGNAGSSDNATVSICPKGWRLPQNGTATKGFYYLLTTAYGLSGSTGSTSMRKDPLNFNLSGRYNHSDGAMSDQGSGGYYGSSTVSLKSGDMYGLHFDASGIYPQEKGWPAYGYSIRCVSI